MSSLTQSEYEDYINNFDGGYDYDEEVEEHIEIEQENINDWNEIEEEN